MVILKFGFSLVGAIKVWLSFVVNSKDREMCSIALLTIIVNGSPTEWFSSTMGHQKECPLSPYLFIFVSEVLSRYLKSSRTGAI